jgi:hypothetical protein
MEDESLPRIVDISKPTEEEAIALKMIEEIKRRHAEELEPYYKMAVEARMRRMPQYIMIPPERKMSFELETHN